MEYKITLDGKKEVKRWFALKPQQIARATRTAVNQVTSAIHKRLGGDLPRESGTSVVGYRRARAKKNPAKAFHKTTKGVVWMGTMDIPAKYAGKMKQVKGGVRVGRHFFENAFVATMRSGYTGVFSRISGSRKIKQEMIEMNNADAQAATAASGAEVEFKNILRKRLHIELDRSKTK